jgi:hypothetical protein
VAIIDDFKTRFNEFTLADVDTYLPALVLAYPCYYGGEYDGCGEEIILNLLAHLLVSETTKGSDALQQVQSQSVGSVSVSYTPGYSSMSARTDWLRSTKYGQRYLMLTRGRSGGFFV